MDKIYDADSGTTSSRVRRVRPGYAALTIERVEHLTLTIAVSAAPRGDGVAPVKGEVHHGLDTLRSAIATGRDADLDRERADLDRERAKLVEVIARRGNGAET